MPVSDGQLDAVVQAWNGYAEESPQRVSPSDLLNKRDVNMYRGLGITNASDLAKNMVDHRSVATMEMTMGYLYERLLEELGPKKVTQAEKKIPGYKGIDFIHTTPSELMVINLKAGLSTTNGDITASTIRNLADSKQHWETHTGPDDNPLAQREIKVVMVRAVARGKRKRNTTAQGVLWLVGESMWEFFGAGEGFLKRLGDALGRNPLDYSRYEEEKERAAGRVAEYLVQGNLASSGGQINWGLLAAKFP